MQQFVVMMFLLHAWEKVDFALSEAYREDTFYQEPDNNEKEVKELRSQDDAMYRYVGAGDDEEGSRRDALEKSREDYEYNADKFRRKFKNLAAEQKKFKAKDGFFMIGDELRGSNDEGNEESTIGSPTRTYEKLEIPEDVFYPIGADGNKPRKKFRPDTPTKLRHREELINREKPALKYPGRGYMGVRERHFFKTPHPPTQTPDVNKSTVPDLYTPVSSDDEAAMRMTPMVHGGGNYVYAHGEFLLPYQKERYYWYRLWTCYAEITIYFNQTDVELHIILSSEPWRVEPFYFVCFGCIDNSQTWIQRNNRGVPMRIEKKVWDPLMQFEKWQHFFVVCNQKGYVGAGLLGYYTVAEFWDTLDPVPIKYIGIATNEWITALGEIKIRSYTGTIPNVHSLRDIWEKPTAYPPSRYARRPNEISLPSMSTITVLMVFGFLVICVIFWIFYAMVACYTGANREGD